jgi:hypothetical protein
MLTKLIRMDITLMLLLLLSGCVSLPAGPSVMVLPAPGKTIEQFQVEDMICRQWAGQQLGKSTQDSVNQSVVSGAAVGTAIGAGTGALFGAASGNSSAGAAIGAGSGLLIGLSSGYESGQAYGWEAQKRYDYAYVQCMYAKGNQIPGQVHRYRIRKVNPPPPEREAVPPDYVPEYSPMR